MKITYAQAINSATAQLMAKDNSIFVMGLEVDGARGIFGTTIEARSRFPERVFDMPLSEAGITGFGTGAALAGMRPIMVHARIDFLVLALDQILNHAAKWSYMTGDAYRVPWVIRTIIGRGKGQGAQHAQALHAMFASVPGLKIVMPSTPFDAKGLLVSSVLDNDPVVFIEHRLLHPTIGNVPEELYSLPIGKGKVVRRGKDVTIFAISHSVVEAMWASAFLRDQGVSAKVVDLRTVRPLDEDLICKSASRTGRVIVADLGHKKFGFGSEVSAVICEQVFGKLKAPIKRIGLPDYPAPTATRLEQEYYPTWRDIVDAAMSLMKKKKINWREKKQNYDNYHGPF